MKPLNVLTPFICLMTLFLFTTTVDADDGKAIFARNCIACHMQGGNIIAPDKTLSKEHLQNLVREGAEYEGIPLADAVYKLLKKGVKGTAMMSFQRLGDDKIKAVRDYVMQQAETGWPE